MAGLNGPGEGSESKRMPGKAPTRQEIAIAREAAEYRSAMLAAYLQQGLDPQAARAKAIEVTDQQVAMRMRELERRRQERMKQKKLAGNTSG